MNLEFPIPQRFDVSTFRRFDVSHRYSPVAIRPALGALVCIALAHFSPACRRDPDEAAAGRQADTGQQIVKQLLIFPDAVRVQDASINDFLERAMKDCAGGDYDRFRLLWSARQEPLPRDEFEQGWQAVRQIRIRTLQKVILAPDPDRNLDRGESVYAFLADVTLDPMHRAGQREPNREVVLMILREHEQWRLASAPKPMRKWIKEQAAAKVDTEDNATVLHAATEGP